ncbi:DUF2771 domain-containing protein [Streptomyces sp. NPDC093085]|uniref:DUF2771 domain-containing protein n=1 Tax=Streptomyces sp. NPDC093085 TaxID=3155068 RepID=UPI00342A28AF
MTVALFSGSSGFSGFARKSRRAGAALGAVATGLLVLAACDKPTPLATVTVGTDSVNTEASCYNDGKAIAENKMTACLNKKADRTITVALDDKIRFGVDPTIAEHGWSIFINGQPAEQEPYTKTYRTIPASAFLSSQASPTGEPATETQVSIVETSGKTLTGVWHFQFKKG